MEKVSDRVKDTTERLKTLGGISGKVHELLKRLIRQGKVHQVGSSFYIISKEITQETYEPSTEIEKRDFAQYNRRPTKYPYHKALIISNDESGRFVVRYSSIIAETRAGGPRAEKIPNSFPDYQVKLDVAVGKYPFGSMTYDTPGRSDPRNIALLLQEEQESILIAAKEVDGLLNEINSKPDNFLYSSYTPQNN